MNIYHTNKTALYFIVFLTTTGICQLTSCTNSSHLLLYQHSNLGMNTGINPANQSIHVRIGVRSEFAAVVPKYVKRQEDTNAAPDYEAASAYFGSRFRVSSIWKIPEAAEVLVTGQAAVIAASNGKLRLKENHDQPTVSTSSQTGPTIGDSPITTSPNPFFGPVATTTN